MFFLVLVFREEKKCVSCLQKLSVGICLHVLGKTLNRAWKPLPGFLQAYAGVADLKHAYI